MKYLIYAIFIIIPLTLIAQENSIEICVKDRYTEEPIPFVNITTGPSSGFVSDENGCFRVRVGNEEKTGIIISNLGYKSDTIFLSSADKRKNIYLLPIIYNLKQILITPDKKSSIISRIIENFSSNYVYYKPYSQEGIYREAIKQGDRYVYLLECLVGIEDKGFRKPVFKNKYYLLDLIEKIDQRKLNQEQKKYENELRINGLHKLYINNFVRSHSLSPANKFSPYINKDIIYSYDYTVDSIVSYKRNKEYAFISLFPIDQTGVNIDLIIDYNTSVITEMTVRRFDTTSDEIYYESYVIFDNTKGLYYPIYMRLTETLNRSSKISSNDKPKIYREFIALNTLINSSSSIINSPMALEMHDDDYLYELADPNIYYDAKNQVEFVSREILLAREQMKN